MYIQFHNEKHSLQFKLIFECAMAHNVSEKRRNPKCVCTGCCNAHKEAIRQIRQFARMFATLKPSYRSMAFERKAAP